MELKRNGVDEIKTRTNLQKMMKCVENRECTDNVKEMNSKRENAKMENIDRNYYYYSCEENGIKMNQNSCLISKFLNIITLPFIFVPKMIYHLMDKPFSKYDHWNTTPFSSGCKAGLKFDLQKTANNANI